MTTESKEPTDLTVTVEERGLRLDRYLADRLPAHSRSRLQALIRTGHVTQGGRTIEEVGHRVKPGETYRLTEPAPEPAQPVAEVIPLAIVYEDAHLIVIDKPAGLVVHPAAGQETGTLVNALIAHCGSGLSGIGGVKRPGIVHRLDKGTSGLLVVAKSDAAHRGLAAQFAAHGRDGRLERRYRALVWGVPQRRQGMVEARLARSTANRTRIAIVRGDGGRAAVTRYAVSEIFPGADGAPAAAMLELQLETGRTHQIRVHMAHIGHPVMGDAVYGAGFKASASRLAEPARTAFEALGRQALHAAHLGFEHPLTGQRLSFDSPLPQDMAHLVHEMRTLETNGKLFRQREGSRRP